MAALLASLLQPLLQSLAQLLLAGLQQWQAQQTQVALGVQQQAAAQLTQSLNAAKVHTDAQTAAAADPDPAGRLLRDWSRAESA